MIRKSITQKISQCATLCTSLIFGPSVKNQNKLEDVHHDSFFGLMMMVIYVDEGGYRKERQPYSSIPLGKRAFKIHVDSLKLSRNRN